MFTTHNDAFAYSKLLSLADTRFSDLRIATVGRVAGGALRTRVTQLSGCLTGRRLVLLGPAIALAGMALMLGYALMLSRAGLVASTPALLAVLLAATLSSIAGFAFSAICGVMLLQMMSDQVQVVEIMMVCSIAIQSLSVAMLWRDIEWRELMKFVVGGAAGLPVGVWLLLHLGHLVFKDAIGAMLTAYAVYVLLKRPLSITSGGAFVTSCVGFLGGITGGLAGFPGAPVTIWCGLRGWEKKRQRGLYQPFILIMQLLGLALIQTMRAAAAHGHAWDFQSLQFIPAALLGTWFGLGIFRRLSDRGFAITVNVLLLVSGIGLLA